MDAFLRVAGMGAIAALVVGGLYWIVETIHEGGAEEARAEDQVQIDKLLAKIDRERMLVAAATALINDPGTIKDKATAVTLCAKLNETGWRMTRPNLSNGACGEYGATTIRFDVAYGPEGDRTVQVPVVVSP